MKRTLPAARSPLPEKNKAASTDNGRRTADNDLKEALPPIKDLLAEFDSGKIPRSKTWHTLITGLYFNFDSVNEIEGWYTTVQELTSFNQELGQTISAHHNQIEIWYGQIDTWQQQITADKQFSEQFANTATDQASLAHAWAAKPENSPVEDGEFSSLHYSKRSEASAESASANAYKVRQDSITAENAKISALKSASDAESSETKALDSATKAKASETAAAASAKDAALSKLSASASENNAGSAASSALKSRETSVAAASTATEQADRSESEADRSEAASNQLTGSIDQVNKNSSDILAVTGAANRLDNSIGYALLDFGTVAKNSSYTLSNPFGSSPVIVFAEVYFNSVWADTGWIYIPGSSGAKATVVESTRIRLMTGTDQIVSVSKAAGGGHGSSRGSTTQALRCRVHVWRVKG